MIIGIKGISSKDRPSAAGPEVDDLIRDFTDIITMDILSQMFSRLGLRDLEERLKKLGEFGPKGPGAGAVATPVAVPLEVPTAERHL